MSRKSKDYRVIKKVDKITDKEKEEINKAS